MSYIYNYTRKQAIEDGVLVDVTETAREAGFRFPVAVTANVWYDYIVPPEDGGGQSIEGRLWDTLVLAFIAIKGKRTDSDRLRYRVWYLMKGNRLEEKELKMVIGPGDNMEPVITIMQPNED